MKRITAIITAIGLAIVLAGCTLPFSAKNKAALQVTSSPKATVFIDAQPVGQTPYFDEDLKVGEYTLRLVPDNTVTPLPSWETKITLSSNILTVVNRQIGVADSDSSGEMLTLEPLSSKDNTILAVVSLPDSAVVKIDGEPRGFTPVSLDNLESGEHTIEIAAAGFKNKSLKAKVTAGHKLTVSIQLAREKLITAASPEPQTESEDQTQASPSPSPRGNSRPSPAPKDDVATPYIEILENPLGFLRIREEPSTQSDEVAQAEPGEKLPYLKEEENGWYKVSYSPGKTGWVARGASGTEYAKLVN